MEFLFVTVDSAGAIHPQLALAQRLVTRGHGVRFLCCRSQQDVVARAGFASRTYTGAPDFDMTTRDDVVRDWDEDEDDDEVVARYCDVIWFGPAGDVADDVVAEVGRQRVDVLAVDYFAFGAAIAAEALGLPTAILWHTGYAEWDALNPRGLPAINAARKRWGLAADASVYDAYRRAHRILGLTIRAFGRDERVPPNLVFVGPQLPPAQEPAALRSRAPGSLPTVLVSIGTSFQDQEGLLARVVEALGGMDVCAIVGTGHAVSYDGPVPPNVTISDWVEHHEVLPGVDLVVSHGGLGTVMAAMAHGVPLLCLPLGRDQHANADHVVELGIGHTTAPSSSVVELRTAISHALEDRDLRDRAVELAAACRNDYDLGAIELERLGDG